MEDRLAVVAVHPGGQTLARRKVAVSSRRLVLTLAGSCSRKKGLSLLLTVAKLCWAGLSYLIVRSSQ